MDELVFDPEVLFATADIIDGYCNRQKTIMEEYLSNTMALSSEWTDDKTLGPLLEEIKSMKNSVVSIMDEIRGKYPAFFRAKAQEIIDRPTM